jgi:anti-sigma factor RsiW
MSAEMLSCRELVQLVTDYLEGVLAPEERLRFERHIAICPSCRGYLAQMRATLAVAGVLTEESISVEARDHLLAAFRNWSADR